MSTIRTRIALFTVSALSLGLGAVANGPAMAEGGHVGWNLAAEADASLGLQGPGDILATEPANDDASPDGGGYWLVEATESPEGAANPSPVQTASLPGVDLIL